MRLLIGLVLALVIVALAPTGSPSAGALANRQLRIGYVPDTDLSDSPVNRNAVAGLRRAVRELGVTAEVRTPNPREGLNAAFEAFARQGYDLVIGYGPGEALALARVAQQYPRTRFAILDVSRKELVAHAVPAPANLSGIVFREQEVAYLVGYLGGLVERRRPGPDILSAVGGIPVPAVNRFIAGYRAGVFRADPGARVLYGYSYEFLATSPCATVASEQVHRGARVVFNVAGACGLGALRVAKVNHVWGIGVDADQSYLGRFVLTSAVKRLDVAVFDTIRMLKRGRYRSGVDEVFGLRNGGTSLGKVSPRVPRSLVTRVRRIERKIVAGDIRVPTSL